MPFRVSLAAVAILLRRSRKSESSKIAFFTISARSVIEMKTPRIIVVGAGPVGVVAALACAQHGFSVMLLEAETKVDDSPLAAATLPARMEMIGDIVRMGGFIAQGVVARCYLDWTPAKW